LLHTFCGSPLYASPEIVNGHPYYGPEVDCWSLGVLLYTLVYGSMPFQGGDYGRLVKQISEGQFIVPRERSGAFGLIKRCLCVKASKRASIDDIAEHWWINVGYAYPPVVFYSYMPSSGRNGVVQALGYEGSPKVSPSIQYGTIGKKSSTTAVSSGMTTPLPPTSTVY
jgi:serine/threonine protein kinase